ncbi:MAG: nucleoside monophosphate kinase [Verrucomicrobia bacterium]|nr:nucleoside monophosphate kinase [Verrucomicrobiota bacterium]
MKKYNAYILFGAPGCGKGTQGKALGTLPGFFHCSCGDVFRSIDPTTPLGQKIAEFSRKGELVPDDITIELWRTYIHNCVQTGSFNPETDKLVLDGIPRNTSQARLLEETVQVEAVFDLQCSNRSELVARLRRRALRANRLDDAKEEVIRHRLDVFDNTTQPLLDFYRPAVVCTVNSQQRPERVLYEVLSHIQNSL